MPQVFQGADRLGDGDFRDDLAVFRLYNRDFWGISSKAGMGITFPVRQAFQPDIEVR